MRGSVVGILLVGCNAPPGPLDWDASVSAEIAVDCPSPEAPYAGPGFDAVVWNGTDYVTAWTRVTGSDSPNGDGSDVVVGRVSPDGTVRDTWGIPVASSTAWQSSPVLAAAGGTVLVGYGEGNAVLEHNRPLRVARVASDGTVLDPEGVYVADGEWFVAAVQAGAAWVVMWAAWQGAGHELRAARLSADLQLLDPGGVLVTPEVSEPYRIAAASDGTDLLLAWTKYVGGVNYDIAGALLTGANFGTPVQLTLSSDPRYEADPALVHDGGRYILAWSVDGEPYRDLFVTSVSNLGVPESAIAMVASGYTIAPALARAGDLTLLTYYSTVDRSVGMVRLDDNLMTLDPVGRTLGTEVAVPRVASDGTDFLVVWGGGVSDGTRIAADGTVLDAAGLRIINWAATQSTASVSWRGDGPFFAWREYHEYGAARLVAARLDPRGTILDDDGILLADRAGYEAPGIAGTGQVAVAVFEDGAVQAVRLGADGTLLDGRSLPVNTARGQPQIDCASDGCLIAWSSLDGVHAALMDADGSVDPGGFVLDAEPNGVSWSRPDVAHGTDGYLVTWQRQEVGTGIHILVSRVSTDGVLVDAAAPMVTVPNDYNSSPRVAFAAGRYLLIWNVMGEIRGLMIDATTGAADGDEFLLGTGRPPDSAYQLNSAHHDVTGHPLGFLVVWEASSRLIGRRFAPDATPLDDEPFSISERGSDPTAATAPDGTIAIGYGRQIAEVPFLTSRIRARFLGGDVVEQDPTCGW